MQALIRRGRGYPILKGHVVAITPRGSRAHALLKVVPEVQLMFRGLRVAKPLCKCGESGLPITIDLPEVPMRFRADILSVTPHVIDGKAGTAVVVQPLRD